MLEIIAHFDGRVLVPDEPVDLPLHRRLRVLVAEGANGQAEPAAEPGALARRIREGAGGLRAPVLSDEALRREHIYED